MSPDSPPPAVGGNDGRTVWSLLDDDDADRIAGHCFTCLTGLANHAVLSGQAVHDTLDERHLVAIPDVMLIWLLAADDRPPPADFKLVNGDQREVWFLWEDNHAEAPEL